MQGIEGYAEMNPTQQMGIMLFAEALKKGGLEKFKKEATDIANVMKNRLDRGKFGDSMTEVLTTPAQFDGLGSPEFMKAYTGKLDDDQQEMLKEAIRISKGVLAGTIKDTTNNADHYYNPEIVDAPLFSKVYGKTKDGVAHSFYNSEDHVKDKRGKTYFNGLNTAAKNNYKSFKWKGQKWDNRYYEEPEQQGTSDFGQAFSQARKQGLKEFEFEGKPYTTEMK